MAEYSEEAAHNKILSYANEEFVIDLVIYFFFSWRYNLTGGCILQPSSGL